MDDAALLRRPVMIVGSARSGTTILGELLQVHSTLHSIVEPRFTWRYGNDRRSDMLLSAHATPKIATYIRQQFARQVRHAGRVRLLEKTPSNALRLEFVNRVFPDCKFIHIIRNGIDTSLSIRSYWHQAAHGIRGVNSGILRERIRELQFWRLPQYALEGLRRFAPAPFSRLLGSNVWGPRLPGIHELLKELELLEVCALQWRTCVEAASQDGRQFPTNRYLEVRLEELDLDKFLEVLDFTELTPEEAVLENFRRKIDPSRSTGRRDSVSETDLKLLRKWITPTMQWLGYSWPVATTPPLVPA